jgi:hypothetical protein
MFIIYHENFAAWVVTPTMFMVPVASATGWPATVRLL